MSLWCFSHRRCTESLEWLARSAGIWTDRLMITIKVPNDDLMRSGECHWCKCTAIETRKWFKSYANTEMQRNDMELNHTQPIWLDVHVFQFVTEIECVVIDHVFCGEYTLFLYVIAMSGSVAEVIALWEMSKEILNGMGMWLVDQWWMVCTLYLHRSLFSLHILIEILNQILLFYTDSLCCGCIVHLDPGYKSTDPLACMVDMMRLMWIKYLKLVMVINKIKFIISCFHHSCKHRAAGTTARERIDPL